MCDIKCNTTLCTFRGNSPDLRSIAVSTFITGKQTHLIGHPAFQVVNGKVTGWDIFVSKKKLWRTLRPFGYVRLDLNVDGLVKSSVKTFNPQDNDWVDRAADVLNSWRTRRTCKHNVFSACYHIFGTCINTQLAAQRTNTHGQQ